MKKTTLRYLILGLVSLSLVTVSCRNAVTDSSAQQDNGTVSGTLNLTVQPFELTGDTSADNMKLHWSAVDGAQSYAVFRSVDGGAYFQIGCLNSTVYDDYAVTGAACRYQVKAMRNERDVIAVSPVVSAGPVFETSSMYTYDNTSHSDFVQRSVLKFGDTYYGYLAVRVNGQVSIYEYTSADGITFSGKGTIVMDPSHSVVADSDIQDGSTNGELYNCKLESMCTAKKGDTVVIWAHYEEAGSTYTTARAVCISGVPGAGYFTYHHAVRPQGYDSRDLTFFADDDGRGYIISAANSNTNLNMYRLSADWTTVDETFTALVLCAGAKREAPSLIHTGGYYYLFSSAAAGWYPSQAKYVSAATIAGLASGELRNIGNTQTFGAQSGQVAKAGNSYLMMANRWSGGWAHPDPVLSADGYWSSQRMLPLSMNNGYAFNDYYYNVKYNCDEGVIIPVQNGRIVSRNMDVSLSDAGQTGCEPENAVDGISDDSSNYYNPDATSGIYNYVVDLGSGCIISEVDVTFRVYNGSEVYNTYTIDGSNDGSTWTTIKDKSDNRIIGFNENSITGAGSYRYVRLHVTGLYRASNDSSLDAGWVRGIHEFTVYGTYN